MASIIGGKSMAPSHPASGEQRVPMTQTANGSAKPSHATDARDGSTPGAGNGLIAPVTTSTHDFRDSGHANIRENIAATNEVGPLPKGRGNHDPRHGI